MRQEKIDFMMNKEYFDKVDGREAQPRFQIYEGLQTEKERNKYLEEHPLSVENMIDEDFKRQ